MGSSPKNQEPEMLYAEYVYLYICVVDDIEYIWCVGASEIKVRGFKNGTYDMV